MISIRQHQRPAPRRPSPVRDRLLHLLRQEHRDEGMTTAEIAERMGRSTESMNTTLCKMAIYGYVHRIPERRDGRRAHELNRWTLP
jgi:predicted transcriptional regulator